MKAVLLVLFVLSSAKVFAEESPVGRTKISVSEVTSFAILEEEVKSELKNSKNEVQPSEFNMKDKDYAYLGQLDDHLDRMKRLSR